MKKKTKTKDHLYKFIAYAIVLFFAVVCLIPFLIVVSGSFSSERAILSQGFNILPRDFSLEAYKFILENPTDILNGYKITIAVTLIGTGGSLFLTSMASYVLSRQDFAWRNKIAFFMYFTTLFHAGLVPSYVWMNNLGMRNHLAAMILPSMLTVNYIFIFRNFVRTIPYEISESGMLDGANDLQIFFRLILPLTKPGFATIGLFQALTYWNSWYSCMLYMDKKEMWTLQYYLQRLIRDAQALMQIQGSVSGTAALPSETVKLAMAILTTGPIILLYPFIQRYFVKGMVVGAVKG